MYVICIMFLSFNSKHLEEIEELKREKTVMQQKIDDLKKKNEVRLLIYEHTFCVVIISPTELCLYDHVNFIINDWSPFINVTTDPRTIWYVLCASDRDDVIVCHGYHLVSGFLFNIVMNHPYIKSVIKNFLHTCPLVILYCWGFRLIGLH